MWYHYNVAHSQEIKIMGLNKKIEISLLGAVLISASIAMLAVATSKLVDSFVSEGEPGSGDWSVSEKEYRSL